MEGVGEAAGQDLVEDGAGAAAAAEEVRPDDLHAGLDPRRGVLLGGHVLEMEPCGSLRREDFSCHTSFI